MPVSVSSPAHSVIRPYYCSGVILWVTIRRMLRVFKFFLSILHFPELKNTMKHCI